MKTRFCLSFSHYLHPIYTNSYFHKCFYTLSSPSTITPHSFISIPSSTFSLFPLRIHPHFSLPNNLQSIHSLFGPLLKPSTVPSFHFTPPPLFIVIVSLSHTIYDPHHFFNHNNVSLLLPPCSKSFSYNQVPFCMNMSFTIIVLLCQLFHIIYVMLFPFLVYVFSNYTFLFV